MEIDRNRDSESRDSASERSMDGERSLPPSALAVSNDMSRHFVVTDETATFVDGAAPTSVFESFAQNLSGLTKIDVSNRGMTQLDVAFGKFKYLEGLIVDGNQLERLPADLGGLTSLKLLGAAGNRLTALPKGFEGLTGLEALCLAGNELSGFPASCVKFERLRILDLSRNAVRMPPGCVSQGLPLLEVLDLSHNRIRNFGLPPCRRSLRKLSLGHDPENEKFPGWLFSKRFSELEELVPDETRFSTFDIPAVGPPPLRLGKLSMVSCGLSDLDFDKISRSMVDLEVLRIGNGVVNRGENVFRAMPARGFANPDKVKEICIRAAGLPALPREVNLLRNLARLDVSRNSISSMPDEICELERLEFLNAAHNSLYALPQAIGKLTSLKVLFLESNKLSGLPDSVRRLASLELADLYNNEFPRLPSQLERLGNLRALDVEGNLFPTENVQIESVSYLEARNILRSASSVLLFRSNNPKVFSESEDMSYGSTESEDHSNGDDESSKDTNPNDVEIRENWDMSEDSADEYDPTALPRLRCASSPFTVSSGFYYRNFCPADLHCARIKDQLAALRGKGLRNGPRVEAGQFDDA